MDDLQIRSIGKPLAERLKQCAQQEGITVSRLVNREIATIIKEVPQIPCGPCLNLDITGVVYKQELDAISSSMNIDTSQLLKFVLSMKYLAHDTNNK